MSLNSGYIGIDKRRAVTGIISSRKHYLERINGLFLYSDIDSDAAAFLDAASISNETMSFAINTLVLDLKAASLWTKLAAFYPFVGGTSTTHKFNLKNPTDSDGAFRLTFSGSWTHDSNGITGDGSTAYANTYFNCLSNFTSVDSGAFGIYSRTDTPSGSTPYDMGASNGSDGAATICISKYSNGSAYLCYGTGSYSPSVGGYSGAGMFTTNRNSSTNTTGYRNASSIINVADSVTLISQYLYIGSSNKGGTATYFSNKNWAAAYIFYSGLSPTNVSDLYTAVQTFQTTLSRNI